MNMEKGPSSGAWPNLQKPTGITTTLGVTGIQKLDGGRVVRAVVPDLKDIRVQKTSRRLCFTVVIDEELDPGDFEISHEQKRCSPKVHSRDQRVIVLVLERAVGPTGICGAKAALENPDLRVLFDAGDGVDVRIGQASAVGTLDVRVHDLAKNDVRLPDATSFFNQFGPPTPLPRSKPLSR